jgi:hypothetical protein
LNPGIPTQTKLESSSFTYAPGDVKFRDLNNDSTIYFGLNTLSDHGDLKVIGNEQPRFLYGFRIAADWKGFDVDIFLQGVGKREYWATGNTTIPGFDMAEAWYAHQMDYWTPENKDAFYPRPANSAQTNNVYNFRIQTKYLQNLAYTRLKNVTFGYTLPPSISKKVSIQKFRIYASGENLFEFDKLGVVPIDPEVGMHSSADARMYARGYPYHRTVSFGMQLTF